MVTSTDERRAENSGPGLDAGGHYGGGLDTPVVAYPRISKFVATGVLGPLTGIIGPWPGSSSRPRSPPRIRSTMICQYPSLTWAGGRHGTRHADKHIPAVCQ
jgi:hypothetical protein